MDHESLLIHQSPDSSHEAWPAGRTSSNDGRSSRFYEKTWPETRKTFSCRRISTSILTGLILCVVLLNFGLIVLLKHAVCLKGSSVNTGSATENGSTAITSALLANKAPIAVVTDCGGILRVPLNGLGYIVYKNGTQYDNDERCAWIITSEANQMQIKFVEHEFNLTLSQGTIWDGFIIGQMDGNHEQFACYRWTITDYAKPHVAVTPFILYFTSDGGTRRGGFVIELTPAESRSGSNDGQVRTMYVNKRNRGTVPLGHPPRPVGTQRRSLLETFAIFQPGSTNSCWKRNFSCSGVLGCSYVLAYEMDSYHEGASCHQEILHEGSFVTSKTMVVLHWLQKDSPNCGIVWEDTQLQLSYNKDLFKAECT